MALVHVTLDASHFEPILDGEAGYLVTVENELFTGNYAAILYHEAIDDSWYIMPPLFHEDYGWYYILYTYEGKVIYRTALYELNWTIHIAVFSDEAARAAFLTTHESRGEAVWSPPPNSAESAL